MKSQKNILIAFILNTAFSIVEFIGGLLTGSVAILSDALHDAGDATSIGVSYFLERKSARKPDKKYTYGYGGYSLVGSLITTMVLLVGSILVIYNAIDKIFNPVKINYNGMIIFAVIGTVVNFTATLVTHYGNSLNQKAVNLHMLEDTLGWIVVLVSAIVMRFTDITIIDPIASIAVAVFILINAFKNFLSTTSLLLHKTPAEIDLDKAQAEIEKIAGVLSVHHIHAWSFDGQNGYATMHLVTHGNQAEIKKAVKKELKNFGIEHATLELETSDEMCEELTCEPAKTLHDHHHHGHHHHGHHHNH